MADVCDVLRLKGGLVQGPPFSFAAPPQDVIVIQFLAAGQEFTFLATGVQ